MTKVKKLRDEIFLLFMEDHKIEREDAFEKLSDDLKEEIIWGLDFRDFFEE